jgi:recombinational DNA repair protein RecT
MTLGYIKMELVPQEAQIMTFRWQKMADKTFMNVLAQYTVVSINI